MNQPFQVVNNEPASVKNYFLEGEPNKNNFPGPFQGLSQPEQQLAAQKQRFAVKNWHNIAEKPLPQQAAMYPLFNAGLPNCESYGNQIPMSPPVQLKMSPGHPNAEGIFISQDINRQNTQQKYQIGNGLAFPPKNLTDQGLFDKARQSGSNHPKENFLPPGMNEAALASTYHQSNRREEDRRENFEVVDTKNLSDFKDESISNPCNQTGFGEIVPKFVQMPEGVKAWTPNTGTSFRKCSEENNPLTDIENRPVEQFSHNNMVPFYGPKLTQNMSSTGVSQAGDNNTCKGVVNGFADVTPYRDKLQTFTGCDEMYMHKRETPRMFSPSEQTTGWVFGSPAIRPDLDRYKTSVWRRNNETPVEKQRVGPGIGLDYSVPAAGGFQQFTRILPNNVSDYKANQLEGRVKGGKWFTEHPTSQYIHGVKKDKPDLYMTQARRPTMRTKFYNNAPEAGDSRITNYSIQATKGKQARTDTEQGAGFGQLDLQEYIYDGSGKLKPKKENFTNAPFATQDGKMPCIDFGQAPVGRIMGSQVPMPTQDLASFNNIRETFKKGAAGYTEKGGFWECTDSTQGANRWGIIMGPATGGVPNQESRQGKYVNFTDRGDVNPYVINTTGTAQAGGLWSPNNWQDQQKVTTKETTQFAYSGNPTGSNMKQYLNTWSDQPKVTTKETTEFSHAGNPSGSTMKQYLNTWSDQPKVTTKETTDFSHSGNPRGKTPMTMDRFQFTGHDYQKLTA